MNNKETIQIIAQAFYGNRTATAIRESEMDRFILGCLSDSLSVSEKIDRTVVRIPNTENLVIVYNKYEEEARRADKQSYWESDGYELKPLAVIPQIGLELYSRCIVCRVNKQGQFESLQEQDYDLVMGYLAE